MAAALLLLMAPHRNIALVAVVEYPGEYFIVDRDSDTTVGPFSSNPNPAVVARTISAVLHCPVVIESKQDAEIANERARPRAMRRSVENRRSR
jgi:hypothetical protein